MTKPKELYYKIKAGEHFEAAGGRVTKHGKVWKGLGPVKNHIRLLFPMWRSHPDVVVTIQRGAELIEYDLVERKRTPLEEVIKEMHDKYEAEHNPGKERKLEIMYAEE